MGGTPLLFGKHKSLSPRFGRKDHRPFQSALWVCLDPNPADLNTSFPSPDDPRVLLELKKGSDSSVVWTETQ